MSHRRPSIDLPQQPVSLGEYHLDWGRLRLDAPTGPIKLTPKAGAVLSLLLRHAGSTVARTTLFDTVWPGSYSSDEVLTQVVQELRRAFDDRQRQPPWLVTVPKLGYRWEGPRPHASETSTADGPETPMAAATPAQPAQRPAAVRLGPAMLVLGVALLSLYLAWSMRPAPLRALPLARPLLREPAQEVDPRLSRDGRRLVYVWIQAEHFELRLRDLTDGRERTLAAGSGASLGAPVLSDDGSRLAYLRRTTQACELHVLALALANAEDRVIARDCPASLPTSLAWSTDGAWLYYSRAGDGIVLAQRSVAIHRIGVDGGDAQRISDAGRWLSVDLHPRLSPDGRQLAFVRDGEGRNRVVLMSASGGAETELGYPTWPYRVDWLGQDLALALHTGNGIELWRGDRQGTLQHTLARDGAGPGMSVAADTGRLVFERHRADDNLWRLDLRAPQEPPTQHSHETGSEIAPRLSPDRRVLAYLSDATGDFEVHRRELPDGARRAWSRLAPRVPLDLRWSPDGKRLALIVGTATGKRLAIMEQDGSLATLPTSLAELAPAQLEWADDGDLWIAVEHDGERKLQRARGPSFERVELVLDRSIAAFALAPDGPILLRPGSAVFERIDGARASPVAAIAIPTDQWDWHAPYVVQATQRGGGHAARIRISTLVEGRTLHEFRAFLPEPPLGRHLDLSDGVLWFAQRDRVESDLFEIPASELR